MSEFCLKCEGMDFCQLKSALEAGVRSEQLSQIVVIENKDFKKCPNYTPLIQTHFPPANNNVNKR